MNPSGVWIIVTPFFPGHFNGMKQLTPERVAKEAHMRIWILVLKAFAYVRLVAATLLILAGIAGTWMKGGFSAVQELLNPFNIANVVVTVLPLAPGLGAFAWADSLKKKLPPSN